MIWYQMSVLAVIILLAPRVFKVVREREQHLQFAANSTPRAQPGGWSVVGWSVGSRIVGQEPVQTAPPLPPSEVLIELGGQPVVLERRGEAQTTTAQDTDVGVRPAVLASRSNDSDGDGETTPGDEATATGTPSTSEDERNGDQLPLEIVLRVKDEPLQSQ